MNAFSDSTCLGPGLPLRSNIALVQSRNTLLYKCIKCYLQRHLRGHSGVAHYADMMRYVKCTSAYIHFDRHILSPSRWSLNYFASIVSSCPTATVERPDVSSLVCGRTSRCVETSLRIKTLSRASLQSFNVADNHL